MVKLIYALRFLTVLPIPWKEDEDMQEVAKSMMFFPLVGLIIGGLLSVISFALLNKVSYLTISTIVIVAWIILTGGLHLDGLSDLFDGFGGRTKEDRLRIMKDSTIGAFGTLSLIIVIVAKIVFVREFLLDFSLSNNLLPLILTPVWGRCMILVSIRFFNSARPNGMGDFFKREMKEINWITPLLLSLILTLYTISIGSLLIVLLLIISIFLFALFIAKKLGGLTGDCYGAICEISELLFLLFYQIGSSI